MIHKTLLSKVGQVVKGSSRLESRILPRKWRGHFSHKLLLYYSGDLLTLTLRKYHSWLISDLCLTWPADWLALAVSRWHSMRRSATASSAGVRSQLTSHAAWYGQLMLKSWVSAFASVYALNEISILVSVSDAYQLEIAWKLFGLVGIWWIET